MFYTELLDKLKIHFSRIAMIYHDKNYDYSWLAARIDYYQQSLCNNISKGDVVQLVSDYTPETVAIFIALLQQQAIISPLTAFPENSFDELALLTQASHRITVTLDQSVNYVRLNSSKPEHALYQSLHASQHPGLVILTSGSTGKPKAIVHDIERLFEKITATKAHLSVLSFLLFDHIGGLNTLINALFSGNTLVFSKSRSPEEVAKSMHEHAVNVLITSPSFLNLMCLKDLFNNQLFLALKQINYGSEVMPEMLLKKLHKLLPEVKLSQAYGMSEIGVLPVRSENSGSLRLKINSDLVNYRIRDQMLEIKSNNSMLGYLNAPSPYTEDGWLKTGDRVEQEGELLRILGRDSEMINVGGEKVFPAEIEEVLLKMPEVNDACVFGEAHGILGNRVVATVSLNKLQTRADFLMSMRVFCMQHLPAFKIPQKVQIVDALDYGHRFKKMRNNSLTQTNGEAA